MRKFKNNTILNHLEKLALSGKISPADLSRLVLPSLEYALPKIRAIFQELSTDKLTPVFEKLQGEYSYEELRIARIILKSDHLTLKVPVSK